MNPPLRRPSGAARPRSRVQASSTTSSAPASPVMPKAETDSFDSTALQLQENVRPEDVLGQFSYAPATKTTVVTTTTTTTTNFPPLMMRAPHHLHDLDPKLYPLAASPTPLAIRKLYFDVDNRPTVFQEADDTLHTLEKLMQQEKALSESHGALRSITNLKRESETPVYGGQGRNTQDTPMSFRTPRMDGKNGLKRPASPVSISEAATLASQEGSRKKRVLSGGKRSSGNEESGLSTKKPLQSRLQIVQTTTPITPHIGSSNTAHDPQASSWLPKSAREHRMPDQSSSKASSTVDENEDDPQILSPQSEATRSVLSRDDDAVNPENDSSADPESQSAWRDLGIASAMTPNVEDEAEDNVPLFRRSDRYRRLRPSAVDTTAAQDASLPSPSLSPVTAAANLQTRRNNYEQLDLGHNNSSGNFNRTLPESHDSSSSGIPIERLSGPNDVAPLEQPDFETELQKQGAPSRSMMHIPAMVDTFEAMPEEMKSYVMYQMLRRCSKPVLHFLAEVINPALKCDFLRLLPVELCLNIIGNLDLKSLCSAAQVSKRWRELVDTSEKLWKRLFDADNYTLQAGELPRAIREGWGWQHASRSDDFEKDLSAFAVIPSDTDVSIASLMPSGSTETPTFSQGILHGEEVNLQMKKSKRKAKAKSKPLSRKQQKRVQSNSAQAMDLDDEAYLTMAYAADGPYAAANAAAVAVPNPEVGLPSLKNLHLFKSIYMRHHIIRRAWMQDEVTPRHIAFRAHQRHVVTCLQFDADKILTGSDDAHINVYDTQTGALRAKLQGHEGGVWALQYEGNVLVSGSTDRSVRVWDIERGICTQTFQGHTSTVRCLQILMPTPVVKTSDGRSIMMPKQPLIITGSRDSNLRVWKLPNPGDPIFHQAGPAPDESAECPYFVRALTGHHHSVRAIAAHADTLVSGSYDCSVRVWKISTGETIHRLQGHTQKVYSVVLDHKRNRCISGSMDNVVKVWSLETGTALFNLEGHSSLVGLLDLQQDRLVSAAADSTLRIWDPENGRCKSTLSAHTGAITCFQHDGQKVVSGSDRTLKMWDVSNGEFAKDLLTDLSGVWQVKFNERRCVAAVQRNNLTYIEASAKSANTRRSLLMIFQVLDFGASRDGIPEHKRGRRIVVNTEGREIFDAHDTTADAEIVADA